MTLLTWFDSWGKVFFKTKRKEALPTCGNQFPTVEKVRETTAYCQIIIIFSSLF